MLKNNKKMMSKMKNLPNDPKNGLAYLQKMLDEPNAYTIIGAENVINPIILLLFANINGNHKFHFSRETIGEHHFFFWIQKDTIYKHELTVKMLELREMGMFEHLDKTYLDSILKQGRINARRPTLLCPMAEFLNPSGSKNRPPKIPLFFPVSRQKYQNMINFLSFILTYYRRIM